MRISRQRAMWHRFVFSLVLSVLLMPMMAVAAALPVIDAHIHYSHDAWDTILPDKAVAILRRAGLRHYLKKWAI